MNYLATARPATAKWLNIIEPAGIPAWLEDYIAAPEMQRLADISTTCGLIYTDLRPTEMALDSLEHSIATALIIWHFTGDRKQTLAGLFHDIATPVFKHSVDFMKGDYLKQEATEELTTEIISHSDTLMALLARDGIDVCEVDDYHLYPIADNDTPRLAADRLEYSLSHLVFTYRLASLATAKRFYSDILVLENEDHLPELGFATPKIAEDFVVLHTRLSHIFRDNITRFSSQFLADILKGLLKEGSLTERDFYEMSESEIISIIETSRYQAIFSRWRTAQTLNSGDTAPPGLYSVNHGSKVRWIDPLVALSSTDTDADGIKDTKSARLSQISPHAKSAITKNLSYKMDQYIYLDFAFPE